MGVNSYSNMGGPVVMWRVAAAWRGGAFYSDTTWVGNCPLCPPAIDAPLKYKGEVGL